MHKPADAMRVNIGDIIDNADAYTGKVVSMDGILLMTGFERGAGEFQEVWVAQRDSPQQRALRAQPVSSASMLWHGLSRLNPRHLPGYPTYRVHDVARIRAQVAAGGDYPAIEILSAAIYRRDFTLYVGVDGARLDQCLPAEADIRALPDIRANIARHLGRRWHVYGTLVIRSAPSAQFLLPGHLPLADQDLNAQLSADDLPSDWLDDIEYPQSDSQPKALDALPESIHIDQAYDLRERLAELPGITQTVVKPAIALGALGARDHELHFATLTDLEQVWLQNITYAPEGKRLESVLKLKNLVASAPEE